MYFGLRFSCKASRFVRILFQIWVEQQEMLLVFLLLFICNSSKILMDLFMSLLPLFFNHELRLDNKEKENRSKKEKVEGSEWFKDKMIEGKRRIVSVLILKTRLKIEQFIVSKLVHFEPSLFCDISIYCTLLWRYVSFWFEKWLQLPFWFHTSLSLPTVCMYRFGMPCFPEFRSVRICYKLIVHTFADRQHQK